MMYGWDWGMGGVFMILLMVVFFAAIVVGIILLVRATAGRASTSSSSPTTPLQVLEDRYARGDINREEFMQRKQDLLGGS